MPRENINDLVAFLAVARVRSFTKAAATLGVSQSALSRTMRGLEEQLGIRLLTRTTRSVSPTEAGARLLEMVGPHLDGIETGLARLAEMRDTPAGNIRITTTEHAAEAILWPAVENLVSQYPDINVEILIEYGLSDIVSERFDAGVRLGDDIAKDMIAVRIGPDVETAVVGAPSYFANHTRPKTPQDLVRHRCINLRLESAGYLHAWEFTKDGHALKVRVEGNLVFNTPRLRIKAALAGLGLAYVHEDQVRNYIADGSLIRVLRPWCPSFSGYHLYYPNRRQSSSAFRLLVEALRYRP